MSLYNAYTINGITLGACFCAISFQHASWLVDRENPKFLLVIDFQLYSNKYIQFVTMHPFPLIHMLFSACLYVALQYPSSMFPKPLYCPLFLIFSVGLDHDEGKICTPDPLLTNRHKSQTPEPQSSIAVRKHFYTPAKLLLDKSPSFKVSTIM